MTIYRNINENWGIEDWTASNIEEFVENINETIRESNHANAVNEPMITEEDLREGVDYEIE